MIVMMSHSTLSAQGLEDNAMVQVDAAVNTRTVSSDDYVSRRATVRMVEKVLGRYDSITHSLTHQETRSWFPVNLIPGWNLIRTAYVSIPVWVGPAPGRSQVRSLASAWTAQLTVAFLEVYDGELPPTHIMIKRSVIVADEMRQWAGWAALQVRGRSPRAMAERATLLAVSKTASLMSGLLRFCGDKYKTINELTNGELDDFLRGGVVW
jgi:hypothetical protein